eukprot:CAMPEP_0184263000 /NCGR_PEP_ID=MMETSP0977-20130417/17069_1 /TAXON_ID=483370 /ORGANISM="non described non described, Strain CCMP2097" /LENGTH=65 /DNA_ID=CAMNT_0026568693 /DNA_START=86 /DNA_END=280 /DNA_ORIENTATION=-
MAKAARSFEMARFRALVRFYKRTGGFETQSQFRDATQSHARPEKDALDAARHSRVSAVFEPASRR